jgi:hypothetical protein
MYGDLFEFLRIFACNGNVIENLSTQKFSHAIFKHYSYLTLGLKVTVEAEEEVRVKGCNEVPAKLLILELDKILDLLPSFMQTAVKWMSSHLPMFS